MVRHVALLLVWLPIALGDVTPANCAEPRLLDDRLQLSLFAEHPQIVTPIGIAIDERDRIYVLESHTHTPPKDYPGPKGDIVIIFTDADNDGKSDGEPKPFANGITAGMNLGFSREGTLYVCAAWELIALPDADADGVADEKKTILRLDTKNTYPHSAQMGIAFSKDDWIYISRGNNGGYAWTVHGTDGSSTSGFGDGGSVYRCRLDGSNVEAVATGFWNSMNLTFDSDGRLLLVDNDPDARGPNRLLQVVDQGDYGYKSIFGGGGNHPFQGWDGALPGTLGFIDGVGEAPCDVFDTDRTAFPIDYKDQLLVTVWNENAVARYFPEQNGASIKATHSVWMQGDAEFRPVAMAADSRGNLFITDWVKVVYPNHGHGRIWRVASNENGGLRPKGYFEFPEVPVGGEEFQSLITASDQKDFKRLEQALSRDDPFVRHAAVVALSRPVFLGGLIKTMYRTDARARLGALLAMRRGGIKKPDLYVKRFLGDPNEQVRLAALMWVGEEGLVNQRTNLEKAIAFDDLAAGVFEAYLAAVECLDPDYIAAREDPSHSAKSIPRKLDPTVVQGILRDEGRSDRVRALALIHLKNLESSETRSLLKELAQSATPVLQREAIRTLSELSADFSDLFLSIANDDRQPADIRAEAILGLSKSALDDPTVLLPLLEDASPTVPLETIRALRVYAQDETIRPQLEKRLARLGKDSADPALLEQFEFALRRPEPAGGSTLNRPASLEKWRAVLKEGGDPVAGERVFFSNHTMCAGCHLIDNRGRRIGPELSNIGQSVSRDQIIDSILKPSEQFAPQYQAWFVELKDGDYYQGLQLDHKSNGGIELYTTEGMTRSWKGSEIENYGVLPRSLMPDGLEQTMTVGELRNLVAFLESLK